VRETNVSVWWPSCCIHPCVQLHHSLLRPSPHHWDFEHSLWYIMQIEETVLDQDRWGSRAILIQTYWTNQHTMNWRGDSTGIRAGYVICHSDNVYGCGYEIERPWGFWMQMMIHRNDSFGVNNHNWIHIKQSVRIQWWLGCVHITKIYFTHWKSPGVCERLWSVNIDVPFSGEYHTLGGHFCWPSE
jgi:hypothetical protein